MAARSNAMVEITRFWLQARHGCLVDESIPVKVHGGWSDLDLLAVRPDLQPWMLPDGTPVVRAIVETKDEHDFDPLGKDFGKRLRADVAVLGNELYTPAGLKVHFSMLRQEHYEKATACFGTADFDRVFVAHALDPEVRREVAPRLAAEKHIHWVTIHEILGDLQGWYHGMSNPTSLRNSLLGDIWHLLVGYCGFSPPDRC